MILTSKQKFVLKLRRLLLMDDTIYDPIEVYEVDVTKPPVWPPGYCMRTMIFGGEKETDQSKRQRRAWREYNEKYTEAFKEYLMKKENAMHNEEDTNLTIDCTAYPIVPFDATPFTHLNVSDGQANSVLVFNMETKEIVYKGKPSTELTREELLECIEFTLTRWMETSR